jgi:hypothetical protein
MNKKGTYLYKCHICEKQYRPYAITIFDGLDVSDIQLARAMISFTKMANCSIFDPRTPHARPTVTKRRGLAQLIKPRIVVLLKLLRK